MTASADSLDAIEAIVIGASAGGVEALTQVLPALPADFRPAVLIVVHVRSDPPSLLPGLFSARCKLPVVEPDDKDDIAGGTIYVAPPGYHMLVEPDRSISLSVDPPVRFSRPSVDVLFESAALCFADTLLGVVLSGANDDGARGLVAIQRAGGRCWVQDPHTAVSDAMPLGAIARSGVHDILTLDAMIARLRGMARATRHEPG
ncbi:chemotaxis protein CheB [Caballeronia sp. SEWSISQ10-4 2]|uniref:chemotaxis protein CheB n=1 Tax=Caballeronia sp. SEWSISQ10-4 2 TaxID=2937438 RepID=UPI002654458C|nr:chemotaxis protein CheB [Caballeronia sp. SEWSISQ10-4 2]MDN7183734.1 chemotaxis protein CheB [Caballeronia sp. SEWSISQ10-4 2]